METLRLHDLQRILQEKNMTWVVKENPFALLSEEEKKNSLGLIDESNPRGKKGVEVYKGSASIPAVVDWRNYKGDNHVTPVKDQHGCGSCVSFATVGVTESMGSIEKGLKLNLSEADQHYCSSHGASCDGWQASAAFKEIQRRGVCDEASAPYGTGVAVCHLNIERPTRTFKIRNVHVCLGANHAKHYLANLGPLTASLDVYQDFDWYGGGVYKHTTGAFRGRHCIMIIGYSEIEQCWICKNSWGATWGDQGFVKIAYGTAGIDQFLSFKLGATGFKTPDWYPWFEYDRLGGPITSRPNAVYSDSLILNVVARGLHSEVLYKNFNGTVWADWQSLGGQIQYAPAICSSKVGQVDVFAVDLDHHLTYKFFRATTGTWSEWIDLGGILVSDVCCTSWGGGRIDVFAVGTDSALWHKYYDGTWHSWISLGGIHTSAPAVAARKVGKLDCFVRGQNNRLYHKHFNGLSWTDWQNLSSGMFGSPSVTSSGENRLDLFYRGKNNNILHKWWDGDWSSDENLGGRLASDFGICSKRTGEIDLFVQGEDSTLLHKQNRSF